MHHALRLVMGSSALGPDTLAPAARQFVLDACDSPDTARRVWAVTGVEHKLPGGRRQRIGPKGA